MIYIATKKTKSEETKVKKTKKESTANRGMDLEDKITKKCEYYEKEGIAQIFKLATNWTVLRRYNPATKQSQIVSAFPKEKSQCDYLGNYNGKSIGIEAKRTTLKTSFPFSNVKDHQWEFFKKWCNEGNGLGYYIVWFKELNRAFMVDARKLQEAKDTLDRKSATIDWFIENSIELDEDLDFIKYIDVQPNENTTSNGGNFHVK